MEQGTRKWKNLIKEHERIERRLETAGIKRSRNPKASSQKFYEIDIH